jgi:hypothetical protein
MMLLIAIFVHKLIVYIFQTCSPSSQNRQPLASVLAEVDAVTVDSTALFELDDSSCSHQVRFHCFKALKVLLNESIGFERQKF